MQKKQNAEAVAKAVKEMNEKAGYDVPMAYATLNTLMVSEQKGMKDVPLFEMKVDMAAMSEIIINRHGALTIAAVEDICQACVVYGWYWAKQADSLLFSGAARGKLLDYLERQTPSMPIDEYMKRENALERGFAEIEKAVEKVEKAMRLQAQMKQK